MTSLGMAGGPEIRQSVSYTGPLVNSLERLVGNAGDGNDLAIAAAQPWRGTPPMGWSPTTTRLIERLEQSIAGRDPTAARPRGRTILRIIRIGRRDSPGSQHHRDRPRLRVPPSHSRRNSRERLMAWQLRRRPALSASCI